MDTDKFDKSFQYSLHNAVENIEFTTYMTNDILKRINKQHRQSIVKRSFAISLVSVSLCICILLSSLIFQPVAYALERIPVLESVIKLLDLSRFEAAEKSGLVKNADQKVSDSGIRISVKDVMYDGAVLSIGYVLEAENADAEKLFNDDIYCITPDGSWKINGSAMDFSAGDPYLLTRKDNCFLFTEEYSSVKGFPDSFDLDMNIDNLLLIGNSKSTSHDIKGSWNFHIPVRLTSDAVARKSFDPPIVMESNGCRIAVDGIVAGPLSTVVYYTSNAMYLPYKLRLTDSKGMIIKQTGSGGSQSTIGNTVSACKNEARFEPVYGENDYLVLTPYIESASRARIKWTDKSKGLFSVCPYETAPINGKMPIVLSQGEGRTLEVLGIENNNDKTIIRYEVHGDNPYVQANEDMCILGENGKPLIKCSQPVRDRTKTGSYSFYIEYKSSELNENCKFATFESGKIEMPDKLSIRIPLK